MNLIRWTPFSEVDSLFSPLLPTAHIPLKKPSLGAAANRDWRPLADISETDKEYLIRAELPSVKKEDITVTLDGDMISIKGERKQETQDKNEKFHRTERFYGSFERRFSLPENIDSEAVRCESKDGILTVHVPKREAPKNISKQIAVQ